MVPPTNGGAWSFIVKLIQFRVPKQVIIDWDKPLVHPARVICSNYEYTLCVYIQIMSIHYAYTFKLWV